MQHSDQSIDGTGLVLQAARFAARKHRDQRRKGVQAEPYINHPLEVADVLWSEGGVTDPEVIAAALLHDTLEDTQTTLNELRGDFGERIAALVGEVSDERSLDWRARKKLQISRARSASRDAKLIKLADKLCNLRSLLATPPANWSIERQRSYFDWAKSVVASMNGTHRELEAKFDEVFRRRP